MHLTPNPRLESVMHEMLYWRNMCRNESGVLDDVKREALAIIARKDAEIAELKSKLKKAATCHTCGTCQHNALSPMAAPCSSCKPISLGAAYTKWEPNNV